MVFWSGLSQGIALLSAAIGCRLSGDSWPCRWGLPAVPTATALPDAFDEILHPLRWRHLNGKELDVKEWRGWQFPDSETHLIDWMTKADDVRFGRPTYQAKKYDMALKYTKGRRRVLDIGANVGLWSWLMAHDFERQDAFEPVAAYADCWRLNMEGQDTSTLHQMALGEKAGTVSMLCTNPVSCGDSTVNVGQAGDAVGEAQMRTLDSFGWDDIDLIKCDNEGFEYFVMLGATETLLRCKPTVIVEQKPGHGAPFGLSDTAAVQYLEKLGMKAQKVLAGDYIMRF
jgi:FkbM family methyltransferase